MFLKHSSKFSTTSVDRYSAAVSISVSVGLNARGIGNKNLSTKPWPWSIFAISFAAFSSWVAPKMLNGVSAGMTLVSCVE